MLQHFRHLRTRMRQVFFGPAYHPADHSALTPRGGPSGVRAMLLVVGTLWVSLVVFDNVARPWQRQPKSWRFFQGLRELNEAPNTSRRVDPTRTKGAMTGDVGVATLTKYYMQDDTTPAYIETDAQGFRTVKSSPPYAVALCGDSFSNNNSFADSLARYTGLSVGNQAIEGRGTLTMARFLEDKPVAYQQASVVIWESTQRAGLDDFKSLPARRQQLRQATASLLEQWHESLLWPANLEVYLTGSSLLKPLLDKTQKEAKWKLTHKSLDLIVLGRTDLPEKVAPILYMAGDEGLRPAATSAAEIDSIADYIATVSRDLRARGQQLVFLIAPDKSVVYADRLPAGMVPRTKYITGLNQALQQRGVKVVNVTNGLQKAAQANPQQLYYYSADTHWTPLGMQVASRIVADSLAGWNKSGTREKGVDVDSQDNLSR